jgi:hypothetical protein
LEKGGSSDTVNCEDCVEAEDNLLNGSQVTDQEIIENVQLCSSNVDITFESEAEEKHGDQPTDEKNFTLRSFGQPEKNFLRICPLLSMSQKIFFSR